MQSRHVLQLSTLWAIISVCASPVCASPATNPAGEGPGIAIGAGTIAGHEGVVAIGKGAYVYYSGRSGSKNIDGDIAIGEKANTWNHHDQSGSIAIGKYALVENTANRLDKVFAFKQTDFDKFGFGSLPKSPDRVVTGVAIGNNTYVRTGGTMIGSHNYRGKIGDIEVSTESQRTIKPTGAGVYSTTVGANSFTNGTVATSTGALNVISSDYDRNDASKAPKNFGATINGTLNSIESATTTNTSAGIANAIVGVANKTANSNGTLVFGAGNEITNSITDINLSPLVSGFGGPDSVTDMSKVLRKLVKDSNSGGATLAIGGGNKADYTLRTAMIGVNNTVTGTEAAGAADNFVVGFNNTASNVIGTTIIGTNRKATGTHNSIIIGSATKETETTASNSVAIGNDANVTVDGGIALGANSVSSRDLTKEASGYDWSTGTASSDTSSTWKPTNAAVSIGDGTTVTRRITSLAAGSEDTDAVNVAQLKRVVNHADEQVRVINTSINALGSRIDTVDSRIDTLGSRLDTLGSRIDTVGAGAAALAGLHPIDFDPDAKWDLAASYGKHESSHAFAVGAYYRPNEDMMLSAGTLLGNGHTMFNVGFSIKVDGAKRITKSRVKLSEEVLILQQEVAELKAMLGLQSSTKKD